MENNKTKLFDPDITKKAIGSVYSGVTNKIKTITKQTYEIFFHIENCH